MRRRQSLTILSALVCTMLALIPTREAAAVSGACIICEEECQNLLLLCELRDCASPNMGASCHPPNADCVWDWDDNDDAILCDYELE